MKSFWARNRLFGQESDFLGKNRKFMLYKNLAELENKEVRVSPPK